MKTTYKSLIAALVLAPTLSSCIEEVFPTNGMTEEQLGSSATATEALVWGMSAFTNAYQILTSNAYDWGYGSQMHIRDVMTEGMAIISSSYDWYTSWEQCVNNGSNMMSTQYIWNYYTQAVLTTNNTIAAINPETANNQQLCFLGMGYAYRANYYLDMARMYEFLPNDKISSVNSFGNDVLGLTVPIVTENTTEEESRDNPRATRQEMYEFLLGDLQKAEEYIAKGSRSSKTQPDLAVVYGLFARLYMWVENYPQAAEYARKAINQHGASTVTTREQWLSTTTGFNDLTTPSWMWGSQCMKEDDVVQSGILNWTSWVSNETTYGYASAGPMSMISASTYNRMSDTDFRKLSYVAPEGSALYGKEPMIDEDYDRATIPTYGSLKFRPGEGNMEDYQVGSATAYPFMRVEEMYFIEAEATAHSNPAQGAQLVTDFMKTYRDPNYTCNVSGTDDVVEEIVFQKSVELWGEGLNFFDLKRLGYSVTRNYPGTNFYSAAAINTNGRPAWVNIPIVDTEGNNNHAVTEWNNPSPADAYR